MGIENFDLSVIQNPWSWTKLHFSELILVPEKTLIFSFFSENSRGYVLTTLHVGHDATVLNFYNYINVLGRKS